MKKKGKWLRRAIKYGPIAYGLYKTIKRKRNKGNNKPIGEMN